MKSLKHVENLVNNLNDTTSADMDKRVLRDTLRALERSQEKSASPKANIFRKITKTQIYVSAVAIVIIVAVLIGITIFSGPGKQPSKKIIQDRKVFTEKELSETTAVDKADTKTEVVEAKSKLDIELVSVEQMFRAGNVNGLITMLSKGEFETKVAAANYLAKMGAVQALEPLENVSDEYGSQNRSIPFARAVETIKSRVATKPDESKASEKPKADTTIVSAKKITGPPPMRTPIRAGNVDRGSSEMGEPSAGLVRSFQAEAKEVNDGYPIKGGDNSIAEVVPTSAHQNLVFYYSFYTGEDPNTAFDVSGNNFHGQVHGARYGKVEILGGVMSFDGQDDYISITNIYLDGFTIAAWVKTPEPDSMNNRRIFTLYDEEHCYAVEGNTRGGISVGAEKMEMDDTTTLMGGETDTTALSSAEDSERISSESGWSRSNWAEGAQFSDYDWRLKSNAWTHITVTYDGVTGRIYRNGRLKEEGDIPAEGFTGTAYIGGIDRHNGGFWRGIIDEVALFNRALTEEEVAQLFLSTGEMVATGPTLTEGASGNGYYFNGGTDYIDVGTISGLGAEQTKMLWINMETSPLTHEVYLIDEGGKNNWIELIDSDGNGTPEIRAGFDEENYFDSEGQIMQGHWCHIAVVSTASGDINVYINGVLDSSAANFSAINNPETIVIGTDSDTQMACFNGIIDEVAIFNRALPDYEIQQVYQDAGRLSGNEPGLLGYWNFDADEGDIVKDSSPYHNDGKLSDI
jgi:hypothetical protein